MWLRLISGVVMRPVTTTMVTITVILFGLVAALRLPVELLPDLAYPSITIQTDFADAAPAEVEELVTRPIEELAGAVPGIVHVESVSREGRSEVVLDFAWGTRVDQALADVREKLDRVRLPTAAARPLVLRFDPSQEPVVRLGLTRPAGDPTASGQGPSTAMARLRLQAERDVERALEKVPGVAALHLHGGDEDEIRVELDADRIATFGLTSQAVVDAIARDNVNRPGGGLTEGSARYLVRTVQEARTPRELEELVIRAEQSAHVRLRDVATVSRAPKEREETVLIGQDEALELALFREGDANTVTVANAILAMSQRLRLPAGQRVVPLTNQARFIEAAIAEVVSNTLLGGALAILVLLFFLRDLRATLVVAAAIPISLLATFIPLNLFGVSLNLMSLGGLALGVGMLVDNGIVVLESIAQTRDRRPELDTRASASLGTAEVADSVVASTLTTVAVFLPMVFVEGVAGQLVADLGLAVSFSILSSLIVSLSLVPVLASLGGPAGDDPTAARARAPLAFLVAPFALIWRLIKLIVGLIVAVLETLVAPLHWAYDAMEARYRDVLIVALRARWIVVLGGLALCVGASTRLRDQGTSLLPDVNQGEFYAQIELPRDASLDYTTAIAKRLMTAVTDDPQVASAFARVGSVTQGGSATGGTTGTHLAQVDVRLVAGLADPDAAERDLAARMQAAVGEDIDVRIGRPALLTFAPPVEVRVFSEDLQRSAAVTAALVAPLRAVPGITQLVLDDYAGRPEVLVHFDRERLARAGVDTDTAATAIARAIQGEIVNVMHAADEQLDIRVQLPRARRSNVDDVARIRVGSISDPVDGRPIPVPLSSVADLTETDGPAEIRRIDGRRAIRIQPRIEDRDLGSVVEDVQAVLDETVNDPLVEADIGGQADELSRSMQSMLLVGALAIFLVYVVMASTFESLHHPLLIMGTVPLALVGVIAALATLSLPISALVGIGAIVLGGIVVNNAIVLINAINARRGRGLDVPTAIVEGTSTRVRPILMTTLTTVLGLLPMALGVGEGAALRQPLAVTVIAGLTASTVLTLFVIPCLYAIVPGRRRDAWATLEPGEVIASLPSAPRDEALASQVADSIDEGTTIVNQGKDE